MYQRSKKSYWPRRTDEWGASDRDAGTQCSDDDTIRREDEEEVEAAVAGGEDRLDEISTDGQQQRSSSRVTGNVTTTLKSHIR